VRHLFFFPRDFLADTATVQIYARQNPTFVALRSCLCWACAESYVPFGRRRIDSLESEAISFRSPPACARLIDLVEPNVMLG
jgi:hypothetical protein